MTQQREASDHGVSGDLRRRRRLLWWSLGVLLVSGRTWAADDCPCSAADRPCIEARDTISAVSKRGVFHVDELDTTAEVTSVLGALAQLKKIESQTPRLYSYLANASFLVGDFVAAASYARKALELQAVPGVERCALDEGKQESLRDLLGRAERGILVVAIRIHPEATPAGLRIESELQLGAASGTHAYRPLRNEDGSYRFNSGRQAIRVEADRYDSYRRELVIEAGKPIDIALESKPEVESAERTPAIPTKPATSTPLVPSDTRSERGSGASTYIGWSLAAAAAVLGGVGVGIAIDAGTDFNDKNAELERLCPGNECANEEEVQNYRDLRNDAKADRTRTYVAIGGSAIFLGAAAYGVVRLLATSNERTSFRQKSPTANTTLVLEPLLDAQGIRGTMRATW